MGNKVSRILVALATVALPALFLATPAHADPAGDFAAAVNNLRASAGAPALATDPGLTSVAQQWANHMAATGVLAHNPNLSSQSPQGWSKMGENIGDGYSIGAVYNALVNSPDHYANMVDPAYNRTGLGIATDPKGQVWVAEDFGAYPPPQPATMAFPTDGTRIFPSPQTFSWSQAPGGQYYCLTVGTTQGGVDLLNSGLLNSTQLSYPVPAFPGSETLWARVYTYTQGTWLWSDVSFSATGPSLASFTRPLNGSANVSTSQPFTWTPVAAASYYGVTVGTSPGGYDLVNTGPLASPQASYQVPALPLGKTLWARVYSFIGGSWNHYTDVSFTAAAH